jgi:hypothetical protein
MEEAGTERHHGLQEVLEVVEATSLLIVRATAAAERKHSPQPKVAAECSVGVRLAAT